MTLAGWNYEKPTEQALLDGFALSLGADMASDVWTLVCGHLGLQRPVTDLGDLARAGDAMISLGGVVRAAGQGAKIRVATYRALERTS